VTGNLDIWTKPFCESIGVGGFFSQAEIVKGKIKLLKILDKTSVLNDFKEKFCVFIGDGANDAGIMRQADFSIASNIIHNCPDTILDVADIVISSEGDLCRILYQLS
jgi:soluble P-type ATPase